MVKTTLICAYDKLCVNYYSKVFLLKGRTASFIASYKTFNPWKFTATDSTAKFSNILNRFTLASSINKLLANEIEIGNEDHSMLADRKKRDKLAALFDEGNAKQK